MVTGCFKAGHCCGQKQTAPRCDSFATWSLSRNGLFKGTATLAGVQVGCDFSINVAHVDLQAPIACGVGFRREKTVLVYGGVGEQIFFTPNNPTLLEVSIKEPVNQDGEVRLYLKALKRGTPILQARLGSPTGPILATQEIDEFEVEISVAAHMVVNDATDTGGGMLTMKPWIAGIDLNAHMFASYSSFTGGETSFSVNTSALDEQGEPIFKRVIDPVTGETRGVFYFEIEMPEDEDSYCFRMAFDQHSPYGTKIGEVACNGNMGKFYITELYIREGDYTEGKILHVKASTENPDNASIHTGESKHKIVEIETNKFELSRSLSYHCRDDRYRPNWDPSARLKSDGQCKAGEQYGVKIDETLFENVIIVVSDEILAQRTTNSPSGYPAETLLLLKNGEHYENNGKFFFKLKKPQEDVRHVFVYDDKTRVADDTGVEFTHVFDKTGSARVLFYKNAAGGDAGYDEQDTLITARALKFDKRMS